MAITRAQQAKQLLNEIAPKGERLAYINSREAKLLKKMGGAGIDVNGTGIRSYMSLGNEQEMNENLSAAGGGPGGSQNQTGGGYDDVYQESSNINTRIANERRAAQARSSAVAAEEQRKRKIQDAIEEDAIRRNPYRYTGTQRALQKGISFAPLLSRLTGITPDYLEEQDKIASTIENIQLGNRGSDVPSQFFGVTYDGPNTPDKDGNITFSDNNPEVNKPFTDAMMGNYKSTVGGFPDRDTGGGGGGGGDNYIPPVYVPPISADTAASTKDDEADPFTAQFTRTGLTDADKERISQIGGRSIFAANGGRIGYDIGGEVMEEQNLQAGAPDLRLEGSQIPQQEEMASAPDIDAELYQLFLDALRKGDVPQGTTFDAYKQLMMQAISEQQGGQMQGPQMAQQEMMQPEMQQGIMQNNTMEPEREMAAYGGIMGSDGRKRYGFGSFFKKAARAIKKVAKSPIGKAALLYAGGAYLGGSSLFAGAGRATTGQGFFSTLGKRMMNPKLLKNLYNPAFLQSTASGGVTSANAAEKILQMKKAAPKTNLLSKALGYVKKDPLTAILAASTAAGLYTKKTNEEEQGLDDILGARDSTSIDPAGIRRQIAANKGNIDPNEYAFLQSNYYAADGGRIGYQDAGPVRPEINTGQIEMLIKKGADNDLIKTFVDGALDNDINQIRDQVNNIMRNNKAQGGLMNLGGNEMDLRGGGFVPLGAKEKADDVPARLSKNEFVFTADAVRAAGGGSVDKGAEKMYNTMKRLEGVVA